MRNFLIFFYLTATIYSQTYQTKALDFLSDKRTEGNLWSFNSDRALIDNRKTIQVLDSLNKDRADLMVTQSYLNLGVLIANNPKSVHTAILDLLLDNNSRKLIDLQNNDGGWGPSEGKKSNALDTVIAANALLDAKKERDWTKTINFIISSQAVDGYWQLSEEPSFSKIELTARVLSVLTKFTKLYPENTELVSLVENTSNLLLSLQQIDGHFKFSGEEEEIKTSAEVYKALIKNIQPSLLVSTHNLLLSSQKA